MFLLMKIMLKTLVLLLAVAMMMSFMAVSGQPSGNVPATELVKRDELIAAQENLLNAYRCLYDVDTEIVPGGCGEGREPDLQPGPTPDTPTQADLAERDQLIQNQENLLNVYRCQFNVDTELVPNGCSPQDTETSVPADMSDNMTDSAERNSNDESVNDLEGGIDQSDNSAADTNTTDTTSEDTGLLETCRVEQVNAIYEILRAELGELQPPDSSDGANSQPIPPSASQEDIRAVLDKRYEVELLQDEVKELYKAVNDVADELATDIDAGLIRHGKPLADAVYRAHLLEQEQFTLDREVSLVYAQWAEEVGNHQRSVDYWTQKAEYANQLLTHIRQAIDSYKTACGEPAIA